MSNQGQAPPPARGEVWWVDLNPTRGHEQSGVRPALVLSVDEFDASPAELVVVAPITSKDKRIPWHVAIQPPEGGLREASFVKVEDLRSVARVRLSERMGRVTRRTLDQVEDRLRILMGL